ncbi:MAG: hypothetical protein ACRDTC_00525 [Pseudonocardiaceae bacterium]
MDGAAGQPPAPHRPERILPTHSEEETYRATLQARTVDGEPHTVIVMRRGHGRDARVWLTMHGARKTTLCMIDREAEQLCELLTQAQHPTG